MRFSNPNFRDNKKKVDDELKEKEEQVEQLLLLDDIMQTTNKETIQIEFIDFPPNAMITGIPKAINLSQTQLGKRTIEYETKFNLGIKQSM